MPVHLKWDKNHIHIYYTKERKIIITLYKKCLGIGKIVIRSHVTVFDIINQYGKTKSFHSQPCSGRSKLPTKVVERWILRKIKVSPSKLSKYLLKTKNKNILANTVKNCLKKLNFHRKTEVKCFLFVFSKINKTKQQTYVKE